MDALNAVGSICSVISLLVSALAVYKIIKIQQAMTQSGRNNKAVSQVANGNRNTQIGKQ